MTDDLVERLRSSKAQGNSYLLAEAADAIEQLTAALATERLEMRGMHNAMFKLRSVLASIEVLAIEVLAALAMERKP